MRNLLAFQFSKKSFFNFEFLAVEQLKKDILKIERKIKIVGPLTFLLLYVYYP